jgi:hypothetical protein
LVWIQRVDTIGEKVLQQLNDNFAMEIVTRMLRLETVPKDVLDEIETILRNEFMSNVAKAPRKNSSHAVMSCSIPCHLCAWTSRSVAGRINGCQNPGNCP